MAVSRRLRVLFHPADQAWVNWLKALFASEVGEVFWSDYEHESPKGIPARDVVLALVSKNCRKNTWETLSKLHRSGYDLVLLRLDDLQLPDELQDQPTAHLSVGESIARQALRDVLTSRWSLAIGEFHDPKAPFPATPPESPDLFRILLDSSRDLLKLLARIGMNDASARAALERPETFSRQSISSLAAIVDPIGLVALDEKLKIETDHFEPNPLWVAWFEQFNSSTITRLRSELEGLAAPGTPSQTQLP